ncbi:MULTISPECIES: DoxX family protein [unclassified Pseudomonas]|uniref:DoxX family protein n=1 Tax=unclassified Pseudomonas TaxID=196821 RepID=UPI002AC8B7EE|nr:MULTISPECIES: DoxX family protein [unclassified Pseudomonas]MEB0045548.1 DoxX family protein [Pseudomonas sp. Dout3]MEB0095431.1 DoxX family protein [Pseudomonas sp. DC1.2]WPX61015.1 DoxX family protein [Pseudomonas sp. DC1.2]
MTDTPPAARDTRRDHSFNTQVERARSVLRVALALFYFVAGGFHLYATAGFVSIVPDWVPYPHAVVIVTGICELLGAVALLTPRLRRLAGILLALYAVCVFPANIKHALENLPVGGVLLGWGYHGPRLALQPVLVWAALFAGDLITWPFNTPKPSM